MDSIVVEEDQPARVLDVLKFENPIDTDHAGMQRNSGIGNSDLRKPKKPGEFLREPFVERYARRPGRGLIAIALLIRGLHGLYR